MLDVFPRSVLLNICRIRTIWTCHSNYTFQGIFMGTAILASINSTCPIVFKLSTIFGAGLARPNWISLRQGNLSALLDGTVRWECSFDKDLTTFRPQFRLEDPPLSRLCRRDWFRAFKRHNLLWELSVCSLSFHAVSNFRYRDGHGSSQLTLNVSQDVILRFESEDQTLSTAICRPQTFSSAFSREMTWLTFWPMSIRTAIVSCSCWPWLTFAGDTL